LRKIPNHMGPQKWETPAGQTEKPRKPPARGYPRKIPWPPPGAPKGKKSKRKMASLASNPESREQPIGKKKLHE